MIFVLLQRCKGNENLITYQTIKEKNMSFPFASTTIHLLAKRKISLVHIAHILQRRGLNVYKVYL